MSALHADIVPDPSHSCGFVVASVAMYMLSLEVGLDIRLRAT